jgi:hypothetical protein
MCGQGSDPAPRSLIYGDDIKLRLLNYIATTLRFSDANVDLNVVAWNR